MSENCETTRVRVSVVTAAYNAEAFIAEAVESVTAQSGFERGEVEHLVIDDGSSDGTASLLESLARPGLRVLRHEGGVNRGVAASRWLGVEAARGEWLALLDADDVYLPDRLTTQLQKVDGVGEDIILVHGAAEPFGSDIETCENFRRMFRKAGRGKPERVYKPLDEPGFLRHNVICASSVLIRRHIALRSMRPHPQVFQVEDWIAWTLAAECSGRFLYLDQPAVRYRMHEASATSRVIESGVWDLHSQLEHGLTLMAVGSEALKRRVSGRVMELMFRLSKVYGGDRFEASAGDAFLIGDQADSAEVARLRERVHLLERRLSLWRRLKRVVGR
ncbi:MAG: glycosyltransferase [Planctomycetota bacterium]